MSDMIEETVTVARTQAGVAWVATRTRNACSHCETSSHCGTAMVAKLFGEKTNLLQIENSLDARAGEQVVIGISNALLLKASVLAYLLPLIMFIATVGLGQVLGLRESVGTLLGFCGLGLGLWIANLITGSLSGRMIYCPVMLRRVYQHTINPTDFEKGVVT